MTRSDNARITLRFWHLRRPKGCEHVIVSEIETPSMQAEVRLCGTLDAAKPVTVPEVENLSKGAVVLELSYQGYAPAHGRGPGVGGLVAILKVVWVLKCLYKRAPGSRKHGTGGRYARKFRISKRYTIPL